MITVGQLIRHLETFDPNLRVLYSCFSDWAPMTLDEVRVNQAYPQRPGSASEFLRRVSPYQRLNPHDMVPETFLCFPGN